MDFKKPEEFINSYKNTITTVRGIKDRDQKLDNIKELALKIGNLLTFVHTDNNEKCKQFMDSYDSKVQALFHEEWRIQHYYPDANPSKHFDEILNYFDRILNSTADYIELKKATKIKTDDKIGKVETRHSKNSIDYFEMLKIHPEIEKVSKQLFVNGHYAPSILEAFKRVNTMVKEKSLKTDLDGKTLMLQVFSPNAPVIKFNEMITESEKNEQEGFMHLFAGAIQGIRNPKAHENVVQNDPHKTMEYLAFASLLCKRLDEAVSRWHINDG